jgi:hypothetical protein
MTTRTAATAIAMSQRTQSIPRLPLPPKALQINQPIKTPPMPQKMVSHMGVLSRLPGATNLPTNPMMIPVMITPDDFHHVSLLQPAASSAGYLQCARHHAPPPAMPSQTTPDPNRWLPCGSGAQKVQLRGSQKGFSVWSSSEKMPR